MNPQRGFLRNFVFGAEDSLVSTVGLLSGISFAGLGSRAIIVSGIILILVEALSMAGGVYVSEDSANDLATNVAEKDNQLRDAATMFVSYILVGLVPLLPYFLASDTRAAFYWSVGASLATLAFVGIFKGYFVKKHPLMSGVKMMLIGGLVIFLSVLVGSLIQI